MNAVGVAGDVTTLLHEAGHAFHVFEADELPYFFQRHPGSEMAEVASMSRNCSPAAAAGPTDAQVAPPSTVRKIVPS